MIVKSKGHINIWTSSTQPDLSALETPVQNKTNKTSKKPTDWAWGSRSLCAQMKTILPVDVSLYSLSSGRISSKIVFL